MVPGSSKGSGDYIQAVPLPPTQQGSTPPAAPGSKTRKIPLENIKTLKSGPPCVVSAEIKDADGNRYIFTAVAETEARANEILNNSAEVGAKVCAAAGGKAVHLSGSSFRNVYVSSNKANQKEILEKLLNGEVIVPDQREWKPLGVKTNEFLKGDLSEHKKRFYQNAAAFMSKKGASEALPQGLHQAFQEKIPPIQTYKDLFTYIETNNINTIQAEAFSKHLGCSLSELGKLLISKATPGYTFMNDATVQEKIKEWSAGGGRHKKMMDHLSAAKKIDDLTSGAQPKEGWFRRQWNRLRGKSSSSN